MCRSSFLRGLHIFLVYPCLCSQYFVLCTIAHSIIFYLLDVLFCVQLRTLCNLLLVRLVSFTCAAIVQLHACNPSMSSSYCKPLLIAQLRNCTYCFDRVHAKSLPCPISLIFEPQDPFDVEENLKEDDFRTPEPPRQFL